MSFPANPSDQQTYTNPIGTVYVYNLSRNAWNIRTTNIGVTGIQGLTGLALGSTGISGQTGIQGGTGILGQTGIRGMTGLGGLVGGTGIQGGTGIIGGTGIQGVTGLIGQTGIQGVTGIGGSGTVGVTGSWPGSITGIIGAPTIGYTGLAGYTGFFGAGFTGAYKGTVVYDPSPSTYADFRPWGTYNYMYSDTGGYNGTTLYRWSLEIPTGSTISDATLYLKCMAAGPSMPTTISVRQLKHNWGITDTNPGGITSESPATHGQATWRRSYDYNGAGGDVAWTGGGNFNVTADASPLTSSVTTSFAAGTWYSWPVTPMVQNWFTNGQPNYGLCVWNDQTHASGDKQVYWYGDHTAATAPYLAVNYYQYNNTDTTQVIPVYVQMTPIARFIDSTTMAYNTSHITDGSSLIDIRGGGWSDSHLMLGDYHLWIDTSGKLRIKSTYPTSTSDGTVVGAQTA